MGTKIILIRHGQTDGNAKKQYCGLLDLELNENGRLQAKKLGCRLEKDNIHRIYSSDRKRAVQSARIIFKGRRINRIAGLREINFGIFEGKSHQEIRETNADIYDKWLSDPYNTVVPGSESLMDFQERVTRALEAIVLANSSKTAAIVCHGGTISIILSRINGSKNFWELIPGSASLNIIEYENNKAKITLFNDISHLNGNL
ncbi:MAG: histidine phosphatase family protein [Candidatus Omnitrophota bacterium]|nr:histidine phosphatase family protein [Candidatus Omnitrophota bacterium]